MNDYFNKAFYLVSNETMAHCLYALQMHMLNDDATRRNESVAKAYFKLRNELMQQGESPAGRGEVQITETACRDNGV